MTAGARRGETDYVWPSNLMRPDGVKLIYLDLNHWVALAKAAVGHPEGSQHVGALETLRAAKASGRYVLPLSSTHFMELSAVKNRRHRVDVADVMEELTGFTVIVSRDVIMRLELEAALDAFGRPRPTPYLPVDLLGRGVLRAFGKIGGLRIRNTDGVDVTDSVRTQWPRGADNFDEWQEKGERLLDRSVLRGPADAEEEAKLRADSWDPMVARRIANERAVQEAEQADRVADKAHWRGQRGRDVAAERHMIIDLNEALSEGLSDRGLTREDVLHDSESSRRFTDSMPSADVCISLTTAYHRNPQTRWTGNRMFDIDAMSVAVPYCDFVATDHEAANALHSEDVPRRLNTTVVSRLEALLEAIDE